MPVIRDRGGDMSKQWYIEFRYWDPHKKRLVRTKRSQIPPRLYPNRIKNKHERTRQLKVMRDAYEILLTFGWTPLEYFDPDILREVTGEKTPRNRCKESVERILEIKKQERSPGGYKSFHAHISDFLRYCKLKGVIDLEVTQIKRSFITQYLREVKATKGLGKGQATNKTRNNYLGSLHVLFEKMIEEEFLEHNPTKGIKKLKEQVKRFVPFTPDQVKHLSQEMEKSQPYLKLFIHFVGYAFLRPAEIVRLQVMDITRDRKYILLRASKGKTGTTQRIPVISQLAPVVDHLLDYNPKPMDYLFTRRERPGPVSDLNTMYFSNRFRTVKSRVAESHGYHFTVDHELYGIRHTFIQDIYRHLRQDLKMTKVEAEYKMMPITRHRTIDALRKYIRDYDLDLPEDWGGMYSIEY